MNLADGLALLIAAFSAGLAVFGLLFTAQQIKHQKQAQEASTWLELRRMFAEHNSVHLALRPGGEWSEPGYGPVSAADWSSVESYMGLFEHCEHLLAKGLLDRAIFKDIYSYRLWNVVANDVIRNEKLVKNSSGWSAFLRLLDRFEIPH